jgi:hypothetical protein
MQAEQMPFSAVLGDAVLGSLILGSDGEPSPEPVFSSAGDSVLIYSSAGARGVGSATGGESE